MSRCCRCGCDKVNFKVFDFDDGTLLWQALLDSPAVATNGEVYSQVYGEPFDGWYFRETAISSRTITFPARNATITPDNLWEVSIDRRNAATGVLEGNSGWYLIEEVRNVYTSSSHGRLGTTTTAGCVGGMKTSAYGINTSGDLIQNASNTVVVEGGCTDPTSAELALTYYFNLIETKTTSTIEMTLGSIGTPAAHSTASFDVDASAATVETEIATAFGANVTAVTVTGTSLDTSGLKIEISFATADEYLATFKLLSPSRVGTTYLRNLKTGIRGTTAYTGGYTSPYKGASCWQDNGNVFRKGFGQFESWDPTSEPWSMDWSSDPFTGKTPLVPDESTLFDLELVSAGGICGISFPRTSAFSDILVNRMSVVTWNDDGTGREEYHNSGNDWTGYYPFGLCVEDGGTDLACISSEWRDDNVALVHGDSFTEAQYRAGGGESVVHWPSGSGSSLSDSINNGDFSVAHYPGFTSTHSAFCDIQSVKKLSGEEQAGVTSESATSGDVGKYVQEEGSGIIHSVTLVEIDRWNINYEIFTEPNSLIDSSTDWRISWENASGTVETTSWFSFSDGLSTVNTELYNMFGQDANGDNNVEASVSGTASPVSVPLFAQFMNIRAFGAKSSGDATEMQTDDFWTISAGTKDFARGSMPEITIDFQNYAPERTNTFGSLKWSDGTVAWSRNFGASTAESLIIGCMLHGGQLYVLSTKQCGETISYGS